MRTLKYGDSGKDVRVMQSALNRAGSSLTVDGDFGGKTWTALTVFQEKNNLEVDGKCGPQTWGALAPYIQDYRELKQAIEACMTALENLPEFKALEEMLYE